MIESTINKFEPSTESIALQMQIQQMLIESEYTQIVHLCEQVIKTEPINFDFHCYLMLAYILQNQQNEAQATYILASIAQSSSEKLEHLTKRFIQILDAEAQRQVNIGNLQNSWIIRQYIKEINPSLINNLLHLIQLSINLKNFRPDLLKEWQVVEFMQVPSIKDSIDVELLSLTFNSITEFCLQLDQEHTETLNYLSNTRISGEQNYYKNILSKFSLPYKLHLGCGKNRFNGWLNIDLDANLNTVDFIHDVTDGLPFEDRSCQIIYNEHMLEHLPVEKGVFLLNECYRVLQVGGVLRIAMPSLDVLLEKANSKDWRNQDWLSWPEYQFIKTRAEMINISFRWWGHQWLYDREELYRRLNEAGFVHIKDFEWGNSEIAELQNRETRKDSLLICEARK